MIAHGVIAPFMVGAMAWSPLQYIGAQWIITFPVMGILPAVIKKTRSHPNFSVVMGRHCNKYNSPPA
jgi:hypothetical protein